MWNQSKPYLRLLFLSALCLSQKACFWGSSDDQDGQLDVTLAEGEKSDGPPSEESNSNGKDALNWRDFFKTSPSARERSALEQTLQVSSESDTTEQLLGKARKQTALGLFLDAEQSYRALIRKESDHPEAHLELAMLYLRRKDQTGAYEILSELRHILKAREKVDTGFIFRYRYTLALLYLQQGNRKKGHEILGDLIAYDKTFTPGYAALASSYLSEEKLSLAEFIVNQGLDRGKEDPSLLNLLGVITERTGSFDKAEYWYDKALSHAATFTPALINKAILAMKKSDYETAENLLRDCLTYQPQNAEAYIALGIVQKNTSRTKDSRASFEKALALDPQNIIARYNLGILLLMVFKKPNDALQLFHEVLQLSDEQGDIKETAQSYIDDIKSNRGNF